MSDDNNNNKTVVKLKGYSSYGFRDNSRDLISKMRLWTLDVQLLPKNKKLREFFLFEHPKANIFVLGSQKQVMMLRPEQSYFGDDWLFLPLRLTGKVYYSVPQEELDLLADETREEENTFWEGEIPGLTPVRELLEKANPQLLNLATHPFVEDTELTQPQQLQQQRQPDNLAEDIEIFYRPYKNAAGHCNHFDCPLCKPVETFLDEFKKANKKSNWLLLGRTFDDSESVRFDRLKGLEELTRIANTLFNVIALNDATNFDRWSRLLDELDN